jgi:hypothetical protein
MRSKIGLVMVGKKVVIFDVATRWLKGLSCSLGGGERARKKVSFPTSAAQIVDPDATVRPIPIRSPLYVSLRSTSCGDDSVLG